jgi:glucan phosphoethanolaminetransferase (alkaline phosphatase superfamily)
MDAIHFFTQKRVLSFIPFLIIISFISSSELIYHFLRQEYLNGLITFLFSLFVFLLPVFLFRKNLKLYLKLLLPIFLLVPLNLAYMIYFNSKISEATVLMLINTNKNEAFELVKSYFSVLIIFIIIYSGVIYLLYRKVPNAISTKVAGYISLCSLAILAISPFPMYLHDHASTRYFNNIKLSLFNVFPGTLADGIINVWHQNNIIKSTKKERDKFTFFSKQDSSITDKQVHILIIGESSRYDHWGINGYVKNTSPFLSKRKSLISYSNVSSGGFMTVWAVPLLLTGVGADNFILQSKQKGITGAFNEAGFTTYWITNQTDFLGFSRIHSLEAKKGYYLLTDFRSTKNVHRDMELVDTLKKVLAEPGNKKFIVIHTLGSHYSYSARYPDEYDIIKPSNKTISTKITDKRFKNVLINSYDNSIIYTDAVIDSVIRMVDRLNNFSSVTFIADHGEDLFDDNRNLTSHHKGSPPSKYDAHIPFFIWYSPKIEAIYPDKIKNLLKHKDAKVSSQNLIYSITSMVGIHYPGQDSLKNLTSPYFKNNKQLIIGEGNKVYSYSDLK